MSDEIVFENVPTDKLLTLLGPVAGLGAMTDILVKIETDLVSLRVVDPAHVAMLSADWTVHTGQTVDICIDYGEAMNALRLFDGEDVRLIIGGGSVTVKGEHGRRTIPLNDLGMASVPSKFPEFDLPVSVLTTVSDLRNSLKCVAGLSDHLTIDTGITGDGPHMIIKTATDRTSAEFEVSKPSISDKGGDGAVASYPWDYFSNIVKSLTDGDLVMSYATDYPLMFLTDRDDIQTEVLIAPRIESE